MSDNEGAGAPGTAGTAEELNLPRATVAKLVTGQSGNSITTTQQLANRSIHLLLAAI